MTTLASRHARGFSILEVLITAGLLAIIGLVAANLVKPVAEAFRRYQLRQELTTDSTSCLYVMSKALGNATRSSIEIDSPGTGYPPNSRIYFRAPDCPTTPCTIQWETTAQNPNTVLFTVPGRTPRILARNVAGLTFDVDVRDLSRIKVTLDMELYYDSTRNSNRKYQMLIEQLMRVGSQ